MGFRSSTRTSSQANLGSLKSNGFSFCELPDIIQSSSGARSLGMAENGIPHSQQQVLRDEDTDMKPSPSSPNSGVTAAENSLDDPLVNDVSTPEAIQMSKGNKESEDASNNLQLQEAAAALDDAQKEWLTAAEALVLLYHDGEAGWKFRDSENLGKILMASQLVVTTFAAYKQCRAGYSQVKVRVAYSKEHGHP